MHSSHSSEIEQLNFRELNVQVRRQPYRRTIGVNVLVTGRIRVTAPVWVPTAKIQTFLLEHEAWIRSNLKQFKALRDQHPPKRYIEGEEFSLLGQKLRLTFVSAIGERYRAEKRDESRLVVEIPQSKWESFDREQPHPELADEVVAYFREVGIETIRNQVGRLATVIDLYPTEVFFRAQKSRWGSCSSKGNICMNWRLIVMPIEVINYVIIHELAHLRHYNHSAAFWNLVASVVPNYRDLRKWLKVNQYLADFLAKRSEIHNG